MSESGIDITTAQRKLILDLLGKYLPNTSAWAYGSRVTWKARPQSDLDMVVFATPEQAHAVAKLKEAFEESDLPFRVDLFAWHEVPEQFQKNIMAEHVLLVEKREESVPDGWRRVLLGDVMDLKRGYDLPTSKRITGNIPVVSSGGISGVHNAFKVKGPGIVTGRYGTIGSVYFIKDNFWPLNTTLYVKDCKGNDIYFLYYFLQKIDFMSCSDKAAVPGVNRNHLHFISSIIPPLPEQRAIAHILGSLDDKISLNRRMNATLEGMAQALFQSWFIDFDPVIDKALAAGNPIPEPLQTRAAVRESLGDARKPLPENIQGLFPDAFEHTEEMGWVPMGWRVQPIESLTRLIGGGTPKTSILSYWDGDIPWFSVVDAPAPSDVYVIDTERRITQEGLNNSSTSILPVGTTIISARGTVGKCAMVGKPMAMNQSCYGVTGKSGISGYFVYYAVREKVADLQRHGHGSVFNTITRDTFNTIFIPFSGTKLTQVFGDYVNSFFQKILINCFEIQKLADTRDTFLPKLLSGELRVVDAENFLEGSSS